MSEKRAWINVIPEEEAEGELKSLYQQEFDSEKQGTDVNRIADGLGVALDEYALK